MRPTYTDINDKILSINQLPAALVELAHSAQLDVERCLRGSGIFREDLAQVDRRVNCQQVMTLISNIEQLDKRGDIALRLGRRYTCSNHLLQALTSADTLAELLPVTTLPMVLSTTDQVHPVADKHCVC